MEKNFQFKNSLGQNFLYDENVIHKIVDNASIDKNTLVVEIGPGGGAISKWMVPLCKQAILYEIDTRLKDYLGNLLKNCYNCEIIFKDFLEVDLKKDLERYCFEKLFVVANLPYYITTPIIMKFINEDILPDKMVIMVQKEVASRLSAKLGSKDYGSLTVFLNYYYDVVKLFDVSRNCFQPKPNVDSAVIEMKLKENRLIVLDMEVFKKLVKDSFSYKRKTIRNNLKDYDLKVISSVLEKYGYDLSVRAEKLRLEIFVEIANTLVEL